MQRLGPMAVGQAEDKEDEDKSLLMQDGDDGEE
jgi:hypothetical protein